MCKKIALGCLLMLLVCVKGQSQTQKGNILLGGGLSFSNTKEKDKNVLLINPNAGLFIVDNFAIGMELSLESETKASSVFTIGPYLRGYFAKTDKGAILGQVSYNNVSSDGKTSSAFGAKGGYAFFLNKNIAIENTVGYLFGDNSTLRIGVGFQIHLNN